MGDPTKTFSVEGDVQMQEFQSVLSEDIGYDINEFKVNSRFKIYTTTDDVFGERKHYVNDEKKLEFLKKYGHLNPYSKDEFKTSSRAKFYKTDDGRSHFVND